MTSRRVVSALVVSVVVAACASSTTKPDSTIHIEGAFTTFNSIDEMVSRSRMVFVGSVIEVADGRFDPAPPEENFKGYRDLAVTIEVEEVLHGDVAAGEKVTIPWIGYRVNDDGSKGPQQIVNNQLPPAVGDRNLWFLGEGDGGTFGLIAYEGRLEIDGSDRLILGPDLVSGAAAEISGLTLERLKQEIDQDS